MDILNIPSFCFFHSLSLYRFPSLAPTLSLAFAVLPPSLVTLRHYPLLFFFFSLFSSLVPSLPLPDLSRSTEELLHVCEQRGGAEAHG